MSLQSWADLVILDMHDCDIIIEVTWLSRYYIVLNCNDMFITLEIIDKENLEWKRVFLP